MIVIKLNCAEEGSEPIDTEHGETENNGSYKVIMFLMMDALIQHLKVATKGPKFQNGCTAASQNER
jgi:hypothetical protein